MACPVCFGGGDPIVRESLNAGIVVLLGVTAAVLGCFARFFVVLARRSRAAAHLVGVAEPPARLEDHESVRVSHYVSPRPSRRLATPESGPRDAGPAARHLDDPRRSVATIMENR